MFPIVVGDEWSNSPIDRLNSLINSIISVERLADKNKYEL